MKYNCLFTRQLNAADEAIRIHIEGTEDFRTFKEKVLEACLVGESRANLQMRRLFTDTSLTDNLSIEEAANAQKAAELLFPRRGLPSKPKLSDAKFEFSKINAGGEMLVIQMAELDSYNDLNIAIKDIYQLIDARLQETNSKELEHMKFINSLPYEQKLKISMIMDVLYGRASVEQLNSRLAQSLEDSTSPLENPTSNNGALN